MIEGECTGAMGPPKRAQPLIVEEGCSGNDKGFKNKSVALNKQFK